MIVNPIARGARAGLRAVERELRRTGRSWSVFETTATSPGSSQATAARAGGARHVVAIGGDGTIRAIAAALAGSAVNVSVIPAGTANLFARNLRIPLAPASAARIAVDGVPGAIDLGRVRTRDDEGRSRESCFLVVAGVGHDADAVAESTRVRKEQLGWTAYIAAGVRRFGKPLLTVTARFDDGPPEHTRAWTVLIHNAARIPGGMRVVPGTSLTDGNLHVAVVSPERPGHWVRIGASGMGMARAEGILKYRTARHVALGAEPSIPVQVDGDHFGRVRDIEAWIDPGAIRVMLPITQLKRAVVRPR